MNRRATARLLLGTSLVTTVLSGAAFAEEASKSGYKIPAELTPVSKWANGFTAEEAVTGSDDAAALVEGIEGVQAAYLFLGTAEPELVAAAQARGDIFPFANHEPIFQVDLEAIPYGAKVAALSALDVLSQ